MCNIAVSKFVKRQTKESHFSYYDGPWIDLVILAQAYFDTAKQGYRVGVLEISVPRASFYTSIIKLKEGDKFDGIFECRHKGEEPRKHTWVVGGRKIPAKSVTLILYHKDVLGEDPSYEQEATGATWEIVSINASPESSKVTVPMSPGTLMSNHFGASGGTKTNMSDSEFVEALRKSFEYWKNKAMA